MFWQPNMFWFQPKMLYKLKPPRLHLKHHGGTFGHSLHGRIADSPDHAEDLLSLAHVDPRVPIFN